MLDVPSSAYIRNLPRKFAFVVVMMSLFPVGAWSLGFHGGEQERLDKLMSAVEAGDFEKFVENGTSKFQKRLLKKQFQHVHEQLAGRLNRGYQSEYLGTVLQHGLSVHLWRISYADGADQTLAKLVMKGSKTAGFWLQ